MDVNPQPTPTDQPANPAMPPATSAPVVSDTAGASEGLTPVTNDTSVQPTMTSQPADANNNLAMPGAVQQPQFALAKKSGSKSAVLVAVIVFLMLAGVAVFAYLKLNKKSTPATTPTTTTQTTPASSTPTAAKSTDVNSTVSNIDKSLSKTNDSTDFSSTDLSSTNTNGL